jgi:hypothetical protein
MPLPDWFISRATLDTAPNQDDSHRIHIAASDPAFPAKREAAFALICAAIDGIAAPMRYTRKGTTWSRSSPQGRTIINLHRNQYGWYAEINLRLILPNGEAATVGAWADGGELDLGQFCKPGDARSAQPGRLAYVDISDDPTTLDAVMTVLRTRALPWLDAHHAAGSEKGIDLPA